MTPNETILKCLMEGGLKFNAENEIILITYFEGCYHH